MAAIYKDRLGMRRGTCGKFFEGYGATCEGTMMSSIRLVVKVKRIMISSSLTYVL